MAFNATDFYNDLIKDSKGLTDDQKAALQSALSDASIAKRLEEGQMRQSDYSRKLAETQKEVAEALNFRERLVAWQAGEEARLAAERAALQGHSSTGDELATGDYLQKGDFEKRLQVIENGAIGLVNIMTSKAFDYFTEFSKKLDTEAVTKKAQEDGTTWAIAYERFTQPEREAKQKAEFEERIKMERAEAAKEAIANAQIPTGNANQPYTGGTPHVLDLAKDSTKQYGWKAAVEAHTKDMLAGTVKTTF